MARLDAILGRGDGAALQPEPMRAPVRAPPTVAEANEKPDPSVDPGRTGEIGTAYRIRTGDLRLERAVSWASRRMRRRVGDGRRDRRCRPTGYQRLAEPFNR